MSHNNFKYHILQATCPDSLLMANGYSAKANKSQGGTWVVFDGGKTTALEAAFALYLVDEVDYPDYFNGKAVNLTHEEAEAIVNTAHATDETLGWRGVE